MYKRTYKFSWQAAGIFVALFATQLMAQPPQRNIVNTNIVLPNTLIKKIHSKINGVDYKLYINLPSNYGGNQQKYPIIYLLDADYSFPLAKQISEHLADRNRIQKSIIVGISYSGDNQYKMNRTRDYTPTFVATGGYGEEYQKNSGGAEQFYQFMSKELFPFIAHKLRVNDKKTFVGHSYGGLYGAYVLVKHPNAFDNYIIVSPSLWYDNHFLIKLLSQSASFNPKHAVNVNFSIGADENKGDYRMVDDLVVFYNRLKNKNIDRTQVTLKILNDLDHDTVFPMGLTIGLMSMK